MSRWRIGVVIALTTIPVLALVVCGSWYLWSTGLFLYVWWPMVLVMGLGYALGWYWQKHNLLLRRVDMTPPALATERDQKAWKLVEARAQAASQLDFDLLSEPEHYLHTAIDLAKELAAYYYPKNTDPEDGLTIPEVLTVIELAAHDLSEMVEKYLPGGHLLTIRDWKRARQVSDWYESATLLYWMVSALINPINTAVRYGASKVGVSQPLRMLQQNLLVWFYTAYLQRLGTYLIDLYSGRLRLGAKRYRELVLGQQAIRPAAANGAAEPEDEEEEPRRATLLVLGQVKAGKSSFVNALLGEQRALVDVLPATNQISRYRLQPPGFDSTLEILDTVGYGHDGPTADQLHATHEAARNSDLIFLVMHARNPARQADLKQLQELRAWFEARPDLKMPSIVGVLTHVDLLTPAMEWSPPYDWLKPTRTKEQHMAQALAAAREQLGEGLAAVLPVCTAPGKIFGIDEGVLPVLTARLEEAKAVAILRLLKAEADRGKVKRVFEQSLAAGKLLVGAVWEQWSKQP